MNMTRFKKENLEKLYKPSLKLSGEDNGQVTIIGGSSLFHGAPLLSLKVASRISSMVFFASPQRSLDKVAEKTKSKLMSFVWVPWKEVDDYIRKSDAVLIGPGFMRFGSEKRVPSGLECDLECKKTKKITKELLEAFPDKKWVIDAGSLQVINPGWIPQGSIVTPNIKEHKNLFADLDPESVAKKYKCTVLYKSNPTLICSAKECIEVAGGNGGLAKGGMGDVLAGLTVSLFAKNDAILAGSCASYISKIAADKLFERVGTNYNADDLADEIPSVFSSLVG
jgi:NAD(P)H-hydrate epimerase